MPAGNKKHILVVGAGPGGLTAGMLILNRSLAVDPKFRYPPPGASLDTLKRILRFIG